MVLFLFVLNFSWLLVLVFLTIVVMYLIVNSLGLFMLWTALNFLF